MHPGNDYGMYISKINEAVPVCIDISGFSAFWATKILGDVWEDEYTGYRYVNGDEDYIDLYILHDDIEFDIGFLEDYDIFTDEDDAE